MHDIYLLIIYSKNIFSDLLQRLIKWVGGACIWMTVKMTKLNLKIPCMQSTKSGRLDVDHVQSRAADK